MRYLYRHQIERRLAGCGDLTFMQKHRRWTPGLCPGDQGQPDITPVTYLDVFRGAKARLLAKTFTIAAETTRTKSVGATKTWDMYAAREEPSTGDYLGTYVSR